MISSFNFIYLPYMYSLQLNLLKQNYRLNVKFLPYKQQYSAKEHPVIMRLDTAISHGPCCAQNLISQYTPLFRSLMAKPPDRNAVFLIIQKHIICREALKNCASIFTPTVVRSHYLMICNYPLSITSNAPSPRHRTSGSSRLKKLFLCISVAYFVPVIYMQTADIGGSITHNM